MVGQVGHLVEGNDDLSNACGSKGLLGARFDLTDDGVETHVK